MQTLLQILMVLLALGLVASIVAPQSHYRAWARLIRWVMRRPARMIPYTLPEPTVYTLPGAPPTGSTVRDRNGVLWRRILPPEDGYAYGQWGAWRRPYPDDYADLLTYAWAPLLASRGPLVLQEPTDEERASETLYGPLTAPWGDPLARCPYPGCELGHGHIGAHIDSDHEEIHGPDRPIEIAVSTSVTEEDLSTYCTCRRPGRHLPSCPRYTRTTGGQ
jgi:hypothetical protein